MIKSIPKVSVIIPTYNKAKSIEISLSSVLNQTLDDIEIIVVDDASTDNTLEILEQYKDRITIIRNQQNLGAGPSRNKGLDIAKGEYIGFIDSDDVIEDTYFEYLYNAGIKTNADVILGCMEFIESYDEAKNYEKSNNDFEEIDESERLFLAFDAGRSANDKLYKKEYIKNLRFPNIRTIEDWPFSKIACFNAQKITVSPAKYFYHYKRKGIKLDNLKQYILSTFRAAEEVETNVVGNDEITYYKKGAQKRLIINSILNILEMEMNKDDKNKIAYYMLKKVTERYGDWKQEIELLVNSPVALFDIYSLISLELKFDAQKLDLDTIQLERLLPTSK